jgi:hypothetical protein
MDTLKTFFRTLDRDRTHRSPRVVDSKGENEIRLLAARDNTLAQYRQQHKDRLRERSRTSFGEAPAILSALKRLCRKGLRVTFAVADAAEEPVGGVRKIKM